MAFPKTVRRYIPGNRFNLPVFLFLLFFWWLIHGGQLASVQKLLAPDTLYLSNKAYFTHVKNLAEEDLLRLAELAALAETARSTEVTVSSSDRGIDADSLRTSFSQLVRRSETVMAASGAAALLLVMMNDLARAAIPWLFQALYGAAMGLYLFRLLELPVLLSALAGRLLEMLLLLFLTIHLALPYSLHFASAIGAEITAPYREVSSRALFDLHEEVALDKRQGRPEQNALLGLDQPGKPTGVDIAHKVRSVADYLLIRGALAVFDFILVPGLLLVGLCLGLRGLIRRLFFAKPRWRLAVRRDRTTGAG